MGDLIDAEVVDAQRGVDMLISIVRKAKKISVFDEDTRGLACDDLELHPNEIVPYQDFCRVLVLISGFGRRLLSSSSTHPIFSIINSLYQTLQAHVLQSCLQTYESREEMNTRTLLSCMNELYNNGNFSCSYASRKSI